MAEPDNHFNALLKIHVDDDILNDPKIVNMVPIVFTRRVNNTSFNKPFYKNHGRYKTKNRYKHPLDALLEQTKPKYNPRNVSKQKLKTHRDVKSFNKFVDKLIKMNNEIKDRKSSEINKLLSSVELAFETIRAQKQQQQETKVVTDTNIEKKSDEENWSSDDEETLVSLVKKKPSTPLIQSTISDKENQSDPQPTDRAIVTPTKKHGPISVIFANEGIMAIHQGTIKERYDIGRDGCVGRFYIKLPPPPMGDFRSVVKTVCCLYRRANAINEILEEFVIQQSAINYMTTFHKCPPGNCVCCCKTKFNDIIERLKIPLSKNNTTSTPPLLINPHLTNVFQGQNSPNTTEFHSVKTLDELVKTLTTNYNGITLTATRNGKLTAIFSTTPSSWDSIQIRILTDILTKISQKLTLRGESLQEFCKQFNTMICKRNLYSSASRLMGAKQTKSIIFMKIADINKLDTTPSNDAVTEKTDVGNSSQKEQETETNNKLRKRKHEDVNYEPVLTKRQTKPTFTHERFKKWAKIHKHNESVSVTQLMTEVSRKPLPQGEKKNNTGPKSNATKIRNLLMNSPKSGTTSTVKTVQKTLIPETLKDPLFIPQRLQQETSPIDVPKKNPILFEILNQNNTGSVITDKFNLTKIPIQYLVSKPIENESMPTTSTMATLVPNSTDQFVLISSDEEP